MATEAQISANRGNAQKSTGPRTREGKAKVALNALKHGLLAQKTVIQGEDPEAAKEATSLKWEVSGEQSQASSPSGLPTSSFTLPTSEETPDGVITNAEAEEQTCDTNPICVAPAAQTPQHFMIPSFQDSNPRPEAEEQTCETNPICAGANDRRAPYIPVFRRRR